MQPSRRFRCARGPIVRTESSQMSKGPKNANSGSSGPNHHHLIKCRNSMNTPVRNESLSGYSLPPLPHEARRVFVAHQTAGPVQLSSSATRQSALASRRRNNPSHRVVPPMMRMHRRPSKRAMDSTMSTEEKWTSSAVAVAVCGRWTFRSWEDSHALVMCERTNSMRRLLRYEWFLDY